MEMDNERKEKIIDALQGLKKHEFYTIVRIVERYYNTESSRLELKDPVKLKKAFDLEFDGTISR